MVEKNIRLKTHLGNGVYDTLHPETNSGIVRVGDKNLDETLGEVTTQLEQTAINPDNYSGTDIEKVQSAITDAIIYKRSIRFWRMYNITGGSLYIDSPNSDRTILYLIGDGGGIIKNDGGYIFTTNQNYAGDVSSNNMKYSSVNGAGTIVLNGNGLNGLIRFMSAFDSFVNVDTIVNAVGSYAQSVRFLGCTITGGYGWAFEWGGTFDVSIENCTIEHRQNGIRNTKFDGNPDNDSLRIINNVIEGLSGKAIELGSSFGVVIQGNYMELNDGGYIDLSKSLNYHNGLTIIGNSFQQSSSQIDVDVPAILLGRMGSGGVTSSGNVSTGVLYKLTNAGNNGRLVSSGDMSYNNKKIVGDSSLLSEMGRVNAITNGVSYGMIKRFNKSITSSLIPAGATTNVVIDFTDTTPISREDLITITHAVGSGSTDFSILNWQTSITGNSFTVRVKNESSGSQQIILYVSVMKIG